MAVPAEPAHNIGTQSEGSLHAALKLHVAEPDDRFEVPIEGFVADIVRGDTLIEIQTGPLAPMGRKLDRLLVSHHVHVVHPVPVVSWLHKPGRSVRRSPQSGSVWDVFTALVGAPTLLDHPNLTVQVVLVEVDVHQVHDPALRRGRGGWRTVDRRLRAVLADAGFRTPDDLAAMLPPDLPDPWTTADLAALAAIPRRTAQQAAYVLRANERIRELGRSRAGVAYQRV